ncbi:putative receptor protein kinase ZmPK1 [Acorus gramineus]|uniref:Receptor-like serine/threonine-protein kinase n=1 Tax=Acorus gramineus TaxID=55184 RepID=A0AAV9BL63_ACOGR|nr:putative receptor protein kinase ZmPK1 [Acorus gramineus]
MRNTYPILLCLLIIIISSCPSPTHSKTTLHRDSSLSVEDEDNFLTSPSGSFSCGFYQVGTNAFSFSIWFTNSAAKTVVWTAARDRPVNGRGSKISFNRDGGFVLTNIDGSVVWSTNTSSTSAATADILDSGNLVIRDPDMVVLWQSFDSPTDTLLPNQPMTRTTRLKSSIADGDLTSGYFDFYFDNDNVLRMMYDGPATSTIYWPNPEVGVSENGRTRYNSSRLAMLDDNGRFNSSDKLQFNASDAGVVGVRRRLTMGYDGNLRLFSLNETSGNWSVAWEALPHLCKVHGLCGQNGICVYAPEPKCTCPPHYEMTDRSDWNRGCKPKFNLSCDQQKIKLVELPHTDFWGYDFTFNINMSFETCRNICMSNCNCVAFRYGLDRKCYDKSALWDGYQSPEFWGTIYLKIPSDLDATVSPTSQKLLRLACNTTVIEPTLGNSGLYAERVGKTQWGYFYGFLTAIGLVEFVFIGLGWWFLFRRGGDSSGINEGYQIMKSQFRRFTYGELKKATKNFSEELGRGGTGAVYKGVLDDQRAVAVKRLEDVTQGEGEFWAEVNTIGRINHMNLVRMYGFCSERKHRLLVYEYVEYGSLDKLLFNDYTADSSLEWEERFKIAVGTAKGLSYLHHECLEWVVHCDIKPENILIDRNYEAKIADFGLMKLSQRGAPTEELSRIRGTKGYMAPEWVLNLPITAKVDVYSFGVVLLEMLRGRRILDWEADVKSLIKVAKERLASGDDSWIEDLVDARLSGDVDVKQAESMALIAFLCVEEEAGKRPTMDMVVETLMAADVLNHEAFTEPIVESVDEFEV